jgi:hypothetical protein
MLYHYYLFCFNIHVIFNIYILKLLILEKIPADTCSFCKIQGHWIENCDKIPTRYQSYCFKCWKTSDHKAKECTERYWQKPPSF